MEHSCNITVVVIEHSSVADIDIAGLPQRGICLEWSVDYSTVLGYTDWGNSLDNFWSVSNSVLERVCAASSVCLALLCCWSQCNIVDTWRIWVVSVCSVSRLVAKAHVNFVSSGVLLSTKWLGEENVISVVRWSSEEEDTVEGNTDDWVTVGESEEGEVHCAHVWVVPHFVVIIVVNEFIEFSRCVN